MGCPALLLGQMPASSQVSGSRTWIVKTQISSTVRRASGGYYKLKIFKAKVLEILVSRQGFEPWTYWLKVSCSTSWAIGSHQFPKRFSALLQRHRVGGVCLGRPWGQCKRQNRFFQQGRKKQRCSVVTVENTQPNSGNGEFSHMLLATTVLRLIVLSSTVDFTLFNSSC